ncbi:hypothetical protein D8674_018963 [Pyrus ussuriensis x Pyrus communis]|uniref:Uncharacterized protein n=1 Tax=Pyrus ussuriensis x Pyrus communis TaxID=2448454 RepID=A0A5N5GB03_9ROSA|nr:hypothetical protein D8674_018963 [Pyrus ussuriensis x Pyrus communis]
MNLTHVGQGAKWDWDELELQILSQSSYGRRRFEVWACKRRRRRASTCSGKGWDLGENQEGEMANVPCEAVVDGKDVIREGDEVMEKIVRK